MSPCKYLNFLGRWTLILGYPARARTDLEHNRPTCARLANSPSVLDPKSEDDSGVEPSGPVFDAHFVVGRRVKMISGLVPADTRGTLVEHVRYRRRLPGLSPSMDVNAVLIVRSLVTTFGLVHALK